jgi:hypothetical protein
MDNMQQTTIFLGCQMDDPSRGFNAKEGDVTLNG